MNVTTKTLATILLIAMLSISSVNVSALQESRSARRRDTRQLERLYKHHDRKLELRASVLGISAEELRERLKNQSFEQVVKKAGFRNANSYQVAVIGKVKEELHRRGWTDRKLQRFVQKRTLRYAKSPRIVLYAV